MLRYVQKIEIRFGFGFRFLKTEPPKNLIFVQVVFR